MIEIKAANEIMDADVQEKAAAAVKYCKYATEFTTENGGKPWRYALIPHDKIAKTEIYNQVMAISIGAMKPLISRITFRSFYGSLIFNDQHDWS